MKNSATLAVRVNRSNANHHLWKNNGTYWCHYTIHLPDFTKRRVRQSLQTGDVLVARQRRDALLASLQDAVGQAWQAASCSCHAAFALAA